MSGGAASPGEPDDGRTPSLLDDADLRRRTGVAVRRRTVADEEPERGRVGARLVALLVEGRRRRRATGPAA